MEGFKRCSKCKQLKPVSEFPKNHDHADGLAYYCKPCAIEYAAAYYAKHRNHLIAVSGPARRARSLRIKLEVLGHYSGGKPTCACCGESNIWFLSMDHINGGGNKHRREMRAQGLRTGGTDFYYSLRRQGYPSGFQVLCFNCNFGRGHNRGICPHKDSTFSAP
jgi:hypothetical protein